MSSHLVFQQNFNNPNGKTQGTSDDEGGRNENSAEEEGKKADVSEVDEDDQVDWIFDGEEEENARVELGLIGRIGTHQNINANAFMSTIRNVWQPKHKLDISNIDKQRVLDGQPWHFERHAILLGEVDINGEPSDIQLNYLPMWVRVYNLPFKGRLNLTNVENVAKKVGIFIKMDKSGSMGIDKSIRVRVNVDVRKPLIQKVKIKMRGGMEDYFDVKYEKPPLFCFYCGKIGHGTKDCDECKEEDKPTLKYGVWMKASPWKHSPLEATPDDDNGEKNCARRLFVTKPKCNTTSEVKKNVTDGTTQDKEACNHALSTFEVQHNEDSMATEQTNQIKNTIGTNEVIQKQDEEKGAQKKWRRVTRQGVEMHKGKEKTSGSKRTEREKDENGYEMMEVECPVTAKKIGCPSAKVEKKKKKLFHFEEMWLREESSEEVIKDAWGHTGSIESKITHTVANLKSWSKRKFGCFAQQMHDCRNQMTKLMDIWEDPWIPSLENFKLPSHEQNDNNRPQMVCELIENGRWKMDLITTSFSQKEVRAIVKIPLPMFNHPDSWAWHLTKDGNFSVRSAYFVELHSKKKNEEGEGTVLHKDIWKRLCYPQGIAARVSMKKRGDVDVICPVCGECEESIMHLLYHCQEAVLI
ncbi:hypothetical protein RDABS01_008667 [Bienertia sinuspersici]